MENIINRVKLVMQEFNIKEDKKFSEIIGLEQKSVNNYIKKRRKPSVEFLMKIHEVLNVNLNWLITGEGEMLKEDNNKIEISADEYERVKEKAEIYSEAFVEERRRMKVKEYVIDELLKILKENNIPVKITEIEKGASRLYGESQEGAARNVG